MGSNSNLPKRKGLKIHLYGEPTVGDWKKVIEQLPGYGIPDAATVRTVIDNGHTSKNVTTTELRFSWIES